MVRPATWDQSILWPVLFCEKEGEGDENMKRIISVITVLAIMVMMVVATAEPAMAQTRTIQCSDFGPNLTGVITINTQTGQVHFNCKRH